MGPANPKHYGPILAGDRYSLARVIEPVKTDDEVVQQSRTERTVPAETKVMRDAGSEKVLIERHRKDGSSIQSLEVAIVVGKPKLVLFSPVLIDAERHSGRINGFIGEKKEIVCEPV